MRGRQTGFTLIELLVVIAIIMILASITVFIAVRARLNARAAFCANNMRQIGLALSNRADRGISRDWTYVGKHLEPDDSILLCPQGPQDGQTNYGVNARLLGKRVYVQDTGATVLLYESKRAGSNLAGDARDVDLRHSGGATFVFLDGHAKRLTEIPPFGP
ncbi:MAG: prepilin-type N-terminal cleavage/methylation domain-containing protein [Armatimonadetes bacterium]|nr:prepilin-type N-terminal cleavage/methylation domain-containing protein [Armatimonadota bacterium]